MMSQCSAKHTTFQCKGDENWACPKCGATPDAKHGGFIVEEVDPKAHLDCDQLHDNDECLCYECDYAASGKQVAKALMAKANACVCLMCNGKGTIDKATVEGLKKAGNEVDSLKAENKRLRAEKQELQDRIAGAIV